MIPALKLDFVAVTETDGVLIVGFADDPFETASYFMLQRAEPPTDDVYVERDGQQCSGHGRVRRWTLTRCQLELELEDSLASRLELPNAFAVRFQCDDSAFGQLGTALSRVFSGKRQP